MEHFEYLCLYSNDIEEFKKSAINIDINDIDNLKTILLRNDEILFDLFHNELKADFTLNNFELLKYYAFIGDIGKLKYLLTKCNVDIDIFISSCNKSTLNNSKTTQMFIFTEKLVKQIKEVQISHIKMCDSILEKLEIEKQESDIRRIERRKRKI